MKSDFRSESFQRKFNIILFVNNLTVGCSIENRENYPKKASSQASDTPMHKIS